jgi:ElaB/YqjD/DUF883 family membrane-anchored ribosome-binding protein
MNEETVNPGAPPPDADPAAILQQSKTHALQAAEELRAAASLKAQQLREAASASASRLRESATGQAERAREFATGQFTQARAQARDWQQSGEAFVRENPTKAVLAALGVGFVLGLIFRR